VSSLKAGTRDLQSAVVFGGWAFETKEFFEGCLLEQS
jgi:hypothetical protein